MKSDKNPKKGAESAHDLLGGEGHPLDVFLKPSNVAVIGATEAPGSVGRTVLWNLISSQFGGAVYPVNPKRPSVLGIKAYRSVAEVPAQVDLAVVVTPAPAVPGVIRECVDAGVGAAIVITAGFKELGPPGAALEQQLFAEARRGGLRIIGPNCLGLMCPATGFNATFARAIARPGNVGFISQSGALCTAVLDWSFQEMVGFSAFISVGSMVDVGWGDLIDYLGNDPRTRSILIYMESVGDARSFLSAAREVAQRKPIIVIKAGRTAAGGKAAQSHTGALTGSDDVLDAAFRRCGVLRVNSIADLFYMAEVLSRQPRPAGPRLTILTNAGGPAVLATDALIANGGRLAELTPESMAALNALLPPHWSRGNPIDILGDAPAERYAKALEIVTKDPNSDGILAILAPQAMTDPTQTAEALRAHAGQWNKPVLASWMGGADVAAGVQILNAGGIPTFPYPDTAVRAFQYMASYSYNLSGLYETPSLVEESETVDRARVEAILRAARDAGRSLLTEDESKRVLAAYGIPVVDSIVAETEDDAVSAASNIHYPVVLKLHSRTITHKTDVGGVKLDLADEAGVRFAYRAIRDAVKEKAGEGHFEGVSVQPMVRARDGYELILGSSVDPQFGPVLLFGLGGQLVEVFQDRALGLPPLNTTLARRMMEQTRIYKALQGVRGRAAVDLAALERILVRFSQLVAEQRWIREIDINPLVASPERIVALDARVVVDAAAREEELPKLAIRPYPSQYEGRWTARDGAEIVIRPIRPEDEPLMVRFHEALSDRTVYFRYLHMMKLNQRVAHERLVRMCFVDYDREIALLALAGGEIAAVARLHRRPALGDAELALVVRDDFQGQGLGSELLRRLVEVARSEGVGRAVAEIHAENYTMQSLCRKLGFEFRREMGDTTLTATLDFEPRPAMAGV
jgi:acetyltransferase